MPVPKRKTSKSRRNKRVASNMHITPKIVATCPTCQAPGAPHQVCKECGHYKGVKVVETKSDRMYKRAQERQARQPQNKEAGQPEEKAPTQK